MPEIVELGYLRVTYQESGRAGIRSAAVRPKRYSFPGRSQSFRPVEGRVSRLRGFGAAQRELRALRALMKRGRTLKQITLKQPHGSRAESIGAARTLNGSCGVECCRKGPGAEGVCAQRELKRVEAWRSLIAQTLNTRHWRDST